jgi:hypothetical protein
VQHLEKRKNILNIEKNHLKINNENLNPQNERLEVPHKQKARCILLKKSTNKKTTCGLN